MMIASHRPDWRAQTSAPQVPWRQMLPYVPLVAGLLLGWQRRQSIRSALRQSSHALQSTRRQLDVIVAHAPVGIAQTDLSGRYTLVNARYCGIVGRPMSCLRQTRMQDITHPEDAARHMAEHDRMIRTGEPFALEKRYLRPDATEVWVVTHMSAVPDSRGRPAYVLAAVQDVTHRRAAEAALRALTASLEQRVAEAVAKRAEAEAELRQAQRLEALGQFAGGVAHDFNNVLQAIAGAARLIQRRPEDKAGVERLARLMVDAAERGAGVTRRLLSFARRDALQPKPVAAGPLLEGLRDALAPQPVEIDAPPGLPPVLADQEQLKTVLLTLASNARDAMARNTPPGTVRLRAAIETGSLAGLQAAAYVRIEVEDTGTGMDSETLAHATEPFFTTKPRGRGTGLGLAMARGFAEQSGGRLLLRSMPGQGTTVVLWLPQGGPAEGADTHSRPPARVMLVDDDADVRNVLADTLTASGCVVSQYASAESALNDLQGGRPPDLLISDLSMQGMDGLSLIRAAQARQPGLPAILLTGYGGTELETAVGRMTDVRLVSKPVRGSVLLQHVEALLDADR